MRTIGRIVASSFIFALAACDDAGSSSAGGDAAAGGAGGGATEAVTGAGGASAGAAPVAFPDAFETHVVTRADGSAADLACAGTSQIPPGGDTIDVALRLVDVTDPASGIGARRVSIFPRDGVVPGACPDFYCFEATTDGDGFVDVPLPRAGWYGLEVPGDAQVVRSLQLHTPAPLAAGVSADNVVVTRSALRQLATLGRLPRDAGAPYLAGMVHDCSGALLEHVLVSVVSPWGDRLQPRAASPADGAPGTVYFDGAETPLPAPERSEGTSTDGRFAVGGLEPAPGLPYRVEAWAVTEPGGAPTRIACETALALDDTITMIGLHPAREDYELDHPCRFP